MNCLSRTFTVLECQPFSTANRENSGGAARNVRETKRGGDDAKPNDPEPNTSVRRCANTMDRDHNKGDHRFLPLDWPPALAQGRTLPCRGAQLIEELVFVSYASLSSCLD